MPELTFLKTIGGTTVLRIFSITDYPQLCKFFLLPLPDDFLVLHSLRMSDWEREVTEVYPSDHWLTQLQGSRWHGLRGTPSRPLAFETLTKEGKRALRLYSSGKDATLASGWYLPAPKINESDEIDIGCKLSVLCCELSVLCCKR